MEFRKNTKPLRPALETHWRAYMTISTNGPVRDNSCEGGPAHIAAVGLALAAYPAGVERGFTTCGDAVQPTQTTLRFFTHAPHDALYRRPIGNGCRTESRQ